VADQAARIRSIQDLSARLNRLTDVQAIADAIVAEASALAAYHDIRVYAADWERGVCEPISFTDRLLGEGDFREALRVDIGEGSFTGWVAAHGEPILSNDALHDPRGHTIEGTDDIEESMLVVPMLFEGRSVGVIALSKLGSNQFSQDDLQTMTIFAGYAAQAMANAGAYERLELQSAELARQLQSQRRLLEINERLLSTLEQGDVMESIADGLRSVVAYDNLSIYRADHVHRILVPVLTRERHAAEVARYIVPFGRGLMGWAVENCEPILANDALGDPRSVQIPDTPADPEALVVVPLLAEGQAIGCLNISRVGSEDAHFSEADFELVKLFAGQASIAMRNAEAHQAVSMRADTDALTGLGNHGAFQRTLSEVISKAARPEHGREPEPVALLMMDLDSFKAYNDRLGHPAGDALLHAVGTAIYGAARSDDRVFRYGGDEFALILPGVDGESAAAVAERVRAAVAKLTARERHRVTISIGLACFPTDATDKNDLIAAADTALYYGKQSGEDRLVSVEEVPREMRDLRGTLDRLARAALSHPDDPSTVDHLVEEAAWLSAGVTSASGEAQSETVRDALLAVARSLDALDTATIGHGDRVGLLSRRIAEALGCDADEASTIELAARLHGLEVIGSAELEPIRSLRGVADIIRGHRAPHTDAAAPLGAHVVAVANAYDTMTTAGDGIRGRRQALEELQSAPAGRYRRDVLEALATVVAVRPRSGAGRRRSEKAPRVRGAA
jgi:diguanylate cyclase (GGDEF)-like protein